MNDKCVCNIMGYRVKDSTAREMIENKDSILEKNKNGELKFWVGTEEEYSALTEKEHNCLYITTDDDIQKTIDVLKADVLSAISGFNKVLYEDSTGVHTGTIINNFEDTSYSMFAITLETGATIIGYKSIDEPFKDYFEIYFTNTKTFSGETEIQVTTNNIVLEYNNKTKSLGISDNSRIITLINKVDYTSNTSVDFPTIRITKIIGIM